MNIINTLLATPFKAKKGTEVYKTFGRRNIYIAEINEDGELGLTNLPPSKRKNESYRDLHEIASAWHFEEDLIKG